MSIDPAGAAPEYVKSTGFSTSWETAIKGSVDTVRNFLGSASGNKFFLYGPNEADANYAALTTAWCDYTQPDAATRQSNCGTYEKDAAKNFQNPAYMVSGRTNACTCNDYTVEVAPVLFRPSPTDTASTLWELTSHEYTHAVQKAFGGPMPGWLMEGGAVHMQCMMGAIRPLEHGGPVAYSECFKTGGGRSPGIIPNVRAMYSRSDAVNWLTLYGADRACGTEAVATYEQNNPLPTDDAFRYGDYIYYDTGALAVAYAIHKSNKTSSDFWRSCSGFWHAHQPYGNIDYSTGWESDVPEGQGWRKALADFTGFATAAEFYANFESFVRPSGGVVSEAAVLAILESDASIASQAASTASFVARGPLTSCTTSARAGCTPTPTPGASSTPVPAPPPTPTPGASPSAPVSPSPAPELSKAGMDSAVKAADMTGALVAAAIFTL